LDHQSSKKMCIELPSCNVKILESLKNHIIIYSFCMMANYVFNLALHTSRVSDLGQNMCHHYLIVYAVEEITCTLHCHFFYDGIYTPHVHCMCGTLALDWHVHCQYNVQIETIDII
jgi:hypothetical protein